MLLCALFLVFLVNLTVSDDKDWLGPGVATMKGVDALQSHQPIIKAKRLPPQIAYAGKTTIIHLGDFFQQCVHSMYPKTQKTHKTNQKKHSESTMHYFLSTLDDSSDPKAVPTPSWIQFDDTIPKIEVTPPKNLSSLEPAYTLRIIAKTIMGSEIAEEECILIIAHSCFEKWLFPFFSSSYFPPFLPIDVDSHRAALKG